MFLVRHCDTSAFHLTCAYRSTRVALITRKYHRLNLIDAGGSEDHRKTWHQHFDDAVVLFYVVSLTDYSHVDAATHRNVLAESFVVYRSLVNSLWFEEGKVKVIVVLAKPDIFEEKIAR